MLNKSGITKTSATCPTQILATTDGQFSVGAVVAKAAGVVENGKTIIKAGTPVTGDLSARTTAFTAAVTNSGTSNAVGIVLHDVDATGGNANATILVRGVVNLSRVDATTKAKITKEVKAAIPAITFLTV